MCQALSPALVVLLLLIFLYQAGTFSPAPKPVAQPEAAGRTDDGHAIRPSPASTGENQPYSISAKTAVQDKDKPNFIALDDVTGATNRSNGEAITFSTRNGLYNSDVKTLDLDTDVVSQVGRPFHRAHGQGACDRRREAAGQQHAG